ncbi:hypothetical protein H5410_051395 [Solanum commersonii]|uniref:Uncharacterized protein n=1 Tax=Solanum commersonii TaxID=4109 RepID=A0A9J5X0U6_SOLCO|nr:hypothetical protein H5410_051395 [Solanum commersonii]
MDLWGTLDLLPTLPNRIQSSPNGYIDLYKVSNAKRRGVTATATNNLLPNSDIKASHKEVERMLREHRSTSMQGKLLKHNLGAEVVDALKDLRDQLSQNETRR